MCGRIGYIFKQSAARVMTGTWRQGGRIPLPRSRCPRHRTQRSPYYKDTSTTVNVSTGVNLDCCAHLPSNSLLPSIFSLLFCLSLIIFSTIDSTIPSHIPQSLRYPALTSSLPFFVVAKRSGKSGGKEKKTKQVQAGL